MRFHPVGVPNITHRSLAARSVQLQLGGNAQLNATSMLFPIIERPRTPLSSRTKSESHSTP